VARFGGWIEMTMGAVFVLLGVALREMWIESSLSSVRWGIVAFVVGAMLFVSRRATARRRPLNVAYDEVTAKRFVVVNEEERPVAEMTANETGGSLEIRATDGTLRARMRVHDNGGIVRLYGPQNVPVVTLGVASNELGFLRILGVNGKPRVELNVDADTGLVHVCGPDGVPCATLRVVSDGGSLRIGDMQGRIRAEVRSEATTALFHIYNEDGTARVEMGADEHGGIIGVLGSDGKPRARVRGMAENGAVRVTDSNGRVVGDFGGDKNAGYLKIYDSEGYLLLQLPESARRSARQSEGT